MVGSKASTRTSLIWFEGLSNATSRYTDSGILLYLMFGRPVMSPTWTTLKEVARADVQPVSWDKGLFERLITATKLLMSSSSSPVTPLLLSPLHLATKELPLETNSLSANLQMMRWLTRTALLLAGIIGLSSWFLAHTSSTDLEGPPMGFKHFSYVSGWFLHDTQPVGPDSGFRAHTLPQFGIIDRVYDARTANDSRPQWERLRDHLRYLNSKDSASEKFKILFVARHGEGKQAQNTPFDQWRTPK